MEIKVLEKEIEITLETGLHARPASLLVQEAMKFHDCEVFFIKDNEEANAKSVISLLSLALVKGTKLTIRVEGSNEEDAMNRIVNLINSFT